MLFNSYLFILCFLPLTLFVYFGLNNLGKYTAAKFFLVIASLIFYGYNHVSYVFVILSSIFVNYFLCRIMLRWTGTKKLATIVGIVFNVALLGYFKYFDFLLTNVNSLFGASFDLLHLALPLGISFFTFQQISFLIDTSRGESTCESFWDYILFVTYFPQLVAGPIVSHDEMIPQFANRNNKLPNADNLVKGILAFTFGLFKKVIIADSFGKIVSFGFSNIPKLGTLEALLTILSYTIQIYFDFSGYCDMATGIAWMFNIELPMNFNSPYKATTILDFWKRWHMTLTRFLTKYIYIPLGGNRKGSLRTYLNIFLTFLISGIWHGAGYTFIIWGILHGIANILTRLLDKQIRRIPRWINWCITFAFLNLTWVVFRAENLQQVPDLFSRIFAGGFNINADLEYIMGQMLLVGIPYRFLSLRLVLTGYAALTLALAVLAPNTNQIIASGKHLKLLLPLAAVLFVFSVLSLSGVSTFLYFNF